ncbi:hypothetical protein GJ496_000606 [Pomphorhynchus laevis]|nr:hypothetical protein GJ496_000606 [Pomphorhynchus laevis]
MLQSILERTCRLCKKRISDSGIKLNNVTEFDKFPDESHCFLCLGILTKYCNSSFADQALQKIKSDGFLNFSSFSLCVKISVVADVREACLMRYLSLISTDCQAYPKLDTKYFWKSRMSAILENFLQMQYTNNKPSMTINVMFKERWNADLNKFCKILNFTSTDKKRKCDDSAVPAKETILKYITMITNPIIIEEFLKLQLDDDVDCEIKIEANSIYLAGRYVKLSRNISQSPGFANQGKIGQSVEEMLTKAVCDATDHSECKFVTAGREDTDVLMLGRGRPFYLELINPKFPGISQKFIRQIQEIINASMEYIKINDLQAIQIDQLHYIKEGEQDRKKVYRILCYCSDSLSESSDALERIRNLNGLTDLTIYQRTPLRVLNARSLSTRKRVINEIKVSNIDIIGGHEFELVVRSQAGT